MEILLGRNDVSPDKPDKAAEHRSRVPLEMTMRER